MTLTSQPILDEEIAPATPTIPHSREAEEAVLGAVIINPECFYELQFLNAEHFYIARHRWIWESLRKLDERRTPIDLLTLTEELDRKGQLAEIGGPAYLTALINQVPSSLNAVSYARIVEGHAIRRKMITTANAIANLAYSERTPVEECLSQSSNMFAGLEVLSSNHHFVGLSDLLSETLDDVSARSKAPKEVWGMATGFPKYDRKTGGIQQGELVYLVGAPGIGKTWIADTWSIELARQAPGAILSLEMKKRAIGRRILSGVSGVSTRSMKSGYIKDAEWPMLVSAIEQYSHLPIFIDDSSYNTTQLRAALSWAKQAKGIRWFILDYALLLTDTGRDETEQSKIISANMKRIVHDLDLAGIVIHSVVKIGMNESQEPQMSDQRGSGQAIHDADIQLFLTKYSHRNQSAPEPMEEDKKRMATLWCSKGRELEESKFSITLTRRGNSPFWGELDEKQKYNEREDYTNV